MQRSKMLKRKKLCMHSHRNSKNDEHISKIYEISYWGCKCFIECQKFNDDLLIFNCETFELIKTLDLKILLHFVVENFFYYFKR